MRAECRQQAGVTLLELMVVLAILTALSLAAAPSIIEWNANQRAKAAAREVADLFQLARSEAVRTGNNHVLFFGNPGTADPSGNAVESGGGWVPVLLIDDGPPASANCAIDAGEGVEAIFPEDGLSWGVSQAGAKVSSDNGKAAFNPSPPPIWDGATFADPSNTKINWVLFRPDGIPVAFSGAMGGCGTVGPTGGGGGALYLTNGERDFGVVLSPLGGVRVHLWSDSQWSS